MRVYPCNTVNNYSIYKYKYTKSNSSKPTFTSSRYEYIESGYSPYEIELAQRCLCVKDPVSYLKKEIGTDFFAMYTMGEVLELMKKYKEQESSTRGEIRALDTMLGIINERTDKLTKREEEIAREIEMTGIKNAIDKIKLNKTLAQEKRKKQVHEELDSKYIALEELEQKSFPNAIMIKGMDNKDEQEEVMKYLRRKNCEVLRLNFDNIPLDVVHKEISACAKNIKNSGKHSILYIENFDKYTIPTKDNFDFINRLKGFLCACSKNYDTTVLVFESHPEKLDENIIGRHRFQKEIDVSKIKADNFCEFIPKYDGYSLIYDDNENSKIDLYLGHFGADKYTLWIDSEDPKQIRLALDKIDKIKKLYKFKDVKFAQSPCPNGFKELEGYMFYPESNVTMDYKTIYSYKI